MNALAGIAALMVSGAALAAPASGQVIAVAPKCVVNAKPTVGSPMVVAGSGFTPGDMVELSGGGADGTTTAGTAGAFDTLIQAPILPTPFAAAQKFTLTAQDETTGTGSTSTTFWVANLAFDTNPSFAKPSKKVTFKFSGFKSGAMIYGHYLAGKKVAATHAFGRAKGVCGQLTAKSQLFPGGDPRANKYKVQIDDSRHYRAKSLPRVDSSLAIERL